MSVITLGKRIFTWIITLIGCLVAVIFTIILVRGFDARRMPDLKIWHTTRLTPEFKASDMKPGFTFEDYLKLEDQLFENVKVSVDQRIAKEDQHILNRYFAGSICHPDRQEKNWNRTFELSPEHPKGGILLLHGLSDGPYSMRALAHIFYRQGYYALVPRLPGHGTIPSSLKGPTWKDWVAAADVAAHHVRAVIGPDAPLFLGGYSNGGLIAVYYALNSVNDESIIRPQKLFLFSPAIGITRFAAFSGWHRALSFIPYFQKIAWESIMPEYDPFKYNSFPKIAGHQLFQLARVTQKKIEQLKNDGKLERLPPIQTFSSVVDSTVLAPSLVTHLYNQLKPNGHELILFDVNRFSALEPFIKDRHEAFLNNLKGASALPYAWTLITNQTPDTLRVVAETHDAGSDAATAEPLNIEWPKGIYSLSHVAVPFSPEDPLYGDREDLKKKGYFVLGLVEPRGEKGVLQVPVDQLMRLRYNPFFSYMERRIAESL
ncbi:MAG: alpha/beta fold hydrolase [Candidatus Brocadia sp.]|uniref:Thermostable monoacylglycerol lipase n=1 Tax=Candidatus Brocadia fulgida TaxID=380242 RepID=A0A0M2UW80_9BACT|nr:MAG: Thermostable monoacylglycerol lipase [Candidatus Brocadia fulgida]UJS19618.1 MAG: alpha/beta fold hydrolase [Candidatus Brocadia sp.]